MIEDQLVFIDTFAKLDSIMDKYKNKKIRVAYSGGSDSDNVMWLLRTRGYNVPAVFWDTGLEYAATYEHLDYMRSVGFSIEKVKAKNPIPTTLMKYGQPFVSKRVSDYLSRLQKHGFNFQNDGNKTFKDLTVKYENCKTALSWWCNKFPYITTNITYNRYLKEFLIEYGLPFSVSDQCCTWAKKQPSKDYTKKNHIDLMILGIRKAEGGSRARAYKTCFLPPKLHTYALYFPLFWWKKVEKQLFCGELNIKYSDCYTKYGMTRTGCAGCPFSRTFENELDILRQYEPNLYKGATKMFNSSYEWTRKYKQFIENEKRG